ncbi:MFS general substrate transporter [Lophiostoma macrostomum CBS 122681]|uniref:MFS general substrate transporter n=1 Tax=Lophiostoma macrostomum CBS 122681 TaxID=1314788 RepID=A0A6A6SRK8_9PLEO|nr:MFS general substrate transporter [Lophiostoma macrostomum CBS 122681]
MSKQYDHADAAPRSSASSSDTGSIEGDKNDRRKSLGDLDYDEFVGSDRRPGPSTQDAVPVDDVSHSGRDRRARDLLLNTNLHSVAASPQIDETEQIEAVNEKPISWRALPRKDQLLVLTLSRLSEPLTQTSLGSYIFYQLRSFDPTLPDSTISYQVGIVHASFPAAQFLTAIAWGRFADSEHGGRKRVIWIGLLGTMFSMIGFGFSHSFPMAVLFRCLGGVLNGNIGVMRTMVSEIIKEKKYQSRAFLILPMTFNVGVIIGPILGGLLADPVGSYPSVFGPDSLLGGKTGFQWLKTYPYALPNLMSAIFLLFSVIGVLLFLEETSELCKHKPDTGLRIGRWIRRHIFRHQISDGYSAIPTYDFADVELQTTPISATSPGFPSTPLADRPKPRAKLPFRRIWTSNLIFTLISHGLLAMHVGTFNSLWFIFLSTPRYDPSSPNPPPPYHPNPPFHFTGGLALPPPRIGLALAILGVIGITLQLFLYPTLSHKMGAAKCFRSFILLFPLTYALTPFLSTIPSWSEAPKGASGPAVWAAITGVLSIQVAARTFALPCSAILINNASPHPSVLGTVHGIAQSVSSLTRTFGPIMFGYIFGRGLDIGMVGLAWWILGCVAIAGAIAGRFLYEGDGHAILLEGEER